MILKCQVLDKFDEEPIHIELDSIPQIGSTITLPGNMRFKVANVDYYMTEYVKGDKTIYVCKGTEFVDIYLDEIH
jgi:NADH:ubiquinone oxidoreductase subunit E